MKTDRELLKECFPDLPVDFYANAELKPLINTAYFQAYRFNYHLKNNTAVVKITWALFRVRSLTVIMTEKIKTKFYALRSRIIRRK